MARQLRLYEVGFEVPELMILKHSLVSFEVQDTKRNVIPVKRYGMKTYEEWI
jgi:hypothetical protein